MKGVDDRATNEQFIPAMRRIRPGDPGLAIAYLRVSTEEQQLGPQAQRSAIEAWARRAGVEVVAWHVDQGVSGSTGIEERPALATALQDARERGAGVVVVAKRDRLARDVVIAALVEKAAQRAGARVVSADGVANGDTPQDAFMRTVVDGAAAYERALIRARTKAALAVKKEAGLRVGSVPLGYRLAADGRTLKADEREQAVVREARALRARRLSMVKIAEALTARGFATRSGGRWHAQQVARMLNIAV
jgi:site-specific DNA recombinase